MISFKSRFLFFSFLALAITVNCQPLKIPLIPKMGNGIFRTPSAFTAFAQNHNIFTGFDSANYQKVIIKKIIFYDVQHFMEVNFMDKNRTKEDAMEWHRKYSDATHVLYERVRRNYAAYLYATDKKGLIHFIVDANNNMRFDDDEEFIFDTASSKKHYPIVNVEFDYYDGNRFQTIQVPYTVDPYTSKIVSYMGGIKEELDVLLYSKSYHEGLYKLGNKGFLFQIFTENMGVYKKKPFRIAIQQTESNIPIEMHPFIYLSNQTLEFSSGRYKVDSLTKDTLYLNKIENIIYDAARVGSIAYEIEGEDIMTGQRFSLNGHRGKYVVMNFWGSWCGPCIEELPQLKNLHNKYKNVSFLSIATDNPEELPKLKTLITTHKLTWSHLRVKRGSGNEGLLWNYKIVEYPTSILISPDGKVVVRGTSASALLEIDNYLNRNK